MTLQFCRAQSLFGSVCDGTVLQSRRLLAPSSFYTFIYLHSTSLLQEMPNRLCKFGRLVVVATQ